MPTQGRESQRNADRLSAETYYALLSTLTVIKAQAQMVERWARHVGVAEGDRVLIRLQSIERLVGTIAVALDAIPAAEATGDDVDAAPGDDPSTPARTTG